MIPLISSNKTEKRSTEYLIKQKHKEYMRKAEIYCAMYYFDRLLAGLSGGGLCIAIIAGYSSKLTILLFMLLIVVVIVDFVFKPKERWRIFSHATNRLAIAKIKAQGEYEQYKDIIKIVWETEREVVKGLVDIDSVLEEVSRVISDTGRTSDYSQKEGEFRKKVKSQIDK